MEEKIIYMIIMIEHSRHKYVFIIEIVYQYFLAIGLLVPDCPRVYKF